MIDQTRQRCNEDLCRFIQVYIETNPQNEVRFTWLNKEQLIYNFQRKLK